MVISVTHVIGGVLAGALFAVLVLAPLAMHYRKEARVIARQRDRLLARIEAREAYRGVFDELGRLGKSPLEARHDGVQPRVER